MTQNAIDITGATKRFQLYDNPVLGPIFQRIAPWHSAARAREKLAIDNVTLRVPRGSVVGLVGQNGSGKTTLLKMIAGLLPVDDGKIVVRGRVTTLLQLGLGIHPEISGRKNILYSGLLLGMSRAEIEGKTDSIVSFADIGEYIDQPFRTYSSGMRSRLMFAIAMSVDPDILIVDEALATGDQQFVKKCLVRIREICRSGATVLFVSHDKVQIQRLCDEAHLLSKGRIIASGPPGEIVAAYDRLMFEQYSAAAASRETGDLRMTDGTGAIVLTSVRILDSTENAVSGCYTGDPLVVEITYRRHDPALRAVNVFCGIVTPNDGKWVGEWTSRAHLQPGGGAVRDEPVAIGNTGRLLLRFEPIVAAWNEFALWIALHDSDGILLCEYRKVAPFFCTSPMGTDRGGAFFWQPGRIESVP